MKPPNVELVEKNHHRCAVMIALGLVCYMRLNKVFRDKYRKHIDSNLLPGDISFQDTFNQELNYYCDSIDLPPGIAKTQALKENIFATIVCTVTRIPLIIVGTPGSSKILSFNIIVSNLKGQKPKKNCFECLQYSHLLILTTINVLNGPLL